ncbi:peptidoglycan-binding protein [Mycolicibacterium litorale]|uniref:peptidoglycan-binding protein n=1 Tax=Mycolicibacterium litorale TaxID=758802 RepID=UPI003CEFEE99
MSFRTAYGNTHSENRWRMCNRDECVLVPGPYMNTAPLRRGPAEVVLGDFVRRHHVEVEPIIGPVWGWSAINDVGNSNHLSGTAVDVRATVRPWGARVLPGPVIDRTYRLLDRYKIDGQSGIKWGREWNRADEMHFQLMWPEGDPRWGRLIAQIQGAPVVRPPIPPTPAAPQGSWNPTLQYGSQGAAVLELQRDLNRIFPDYAATPLVEDGEFGPATRAAVQEFQRRADGLVADGIVGPLTWVQLNRFGVKL